MRGDVTGLWVLLAVLLVATAFGLWRRATDGRIRDVPAGPAGGATPRPRRPAWPPQTRHQTRRPALVPRPCHGPRTGPHARRVPGGRRPPASAAEHAGETLTAADLGAPLGARATLVQFSTAFCQPCRATRRTLDEVAGMVDGVAHVEVDAESNLDLVRRFDVMRTPTVLVLDAAGAVRKRATGQPRKADVIAALGQVG